MCGSTAVAGSTGAGDSRSRGLPERSAGLGGAEGCSDRDGAEMGGGRRKRPTRRLGLKEMREMRDRGAAGVTGGGRGAGDATGGVRGAGDGKGTGAMSGGGRGAPDQRLRTRFMGAIDVVRGTFERCWFRLCRR